MTYDPTVTITNPLFAVPGLSKLIADSRFAVRDRMDRLVTFLAQWADASAPKAVTNIFSGQVHYGADSPRTFRMVT